MLPPFIIDQIRRREEEELHRQDQPRLELPIDAFPPVRKRELDEEQEDEAERGVIILDLG